MSAGLHRSQLKSRDQIPPKTMHPAPAPTLCKGLNKTAWHNSIQQKSLLGPHSSKGSCMKGYSEPTALRLALLMMLLLTLLQLLCAVTVLVGRHWLHQCYTCGITANSGHIHCKQHDVFTNCKRRRRICTEIVDHSACPPVLAAAMSCCVSVVSCRVACSIVAQS